MADVLQDMGGDGSAARPTCELEVLDRAELVHVAMQREERTAQLLELLSNIPGGELRREPRIDPGAQYPSSLVAVILLQFLEAFAPSVLHLRRGDPLQRLVLGEHLCGFRYDRRGGSGKHC